MRENHLNLTQLSDRAILIIIVAFFSLLVGFLGGTMIAERTLDYPVCKIQGLSKEYGI